MRAGIRELETVQELPREYPDRPFVGLGAVVWHGPSVLLIRRGKPPRKGKWSLPGGAQQLGETVQEGMIREIREETSLEVELTGLIDVVDSLVRDDDDRLLYHYTLVDFTAEVRSGEAVAGDDVAEVCWADPGDLDAYNLWQETLRIIEMSAAQRCNGFRFRGVWYRGE